MRGDQEIVVVVRRSEMFLVLRRAPERLGYWSLVSGGLEPGETPEVAARRELLEETGLEADLRELHPTLSYSLLDDPPSVRARYAAGIETVVAHPFVVEAPPGWEPVLNPEHDAVRWCELEEALELLHYETTRDAVRAAARLRP